MADLVPTLSEFPDTRHLGRGDLPAHHTEYLVHFPLVLSLPSACLARRDAVRVVVVSVQEHLRYCP